MFRPPIRQNRLDMAENPQDNVAGDNRILRATAKFGIGEIVRHRIHPFRGVIFDIDPIFSNTEEWWQSIPEAMRPSKNQPYYHLLAENEQSTYVAYVSEQNLLHDESGKPVAHPEVAEMFEGLRDGRYVPRRGASN